MQTFSNKGRTPKPNRGRVLVMNEMNTAINLTRSSLVFHIMEVSIEPTKGRERTICRANRPKMIYITI